MSRWFKIALVALGLTPTLALAHPGHAEAALWSGFTHPLGGLDHLAAMLAIGLWAGLYRGAQRLVLPGVFLLALLAGAGLGWGGGASTALEYGIALSVLWLGCLTALARPVPMPVALLLVGAFGLAHGYAHGVEGSSAGGVFIAGFMLASLLLHGIGLWAAQRAQRWVQPVLWRVGGGGLSLLGLGLVLAV